MPTVDLCMWTFNGGKVLAPVLANLNKVIPSEVVGKKFIVDDYSTDNTREIAQRYGWQVFYNKGKGISDGANTVLAWKFAKQGFKWKVDYNVQSIHLRTGLKDELNHQKWYGTQTYAIQKELNKVGIKSQVNFRKIMLRLALAPFSGIFVAFKTREATVAYVHPLIRLYYAWGLITELKSRHYVCPICLHVVNKLHLAHQEKIYVCRNCLNIMRDYV